MNENLRDPSRVQVLQLSEPAPAPPPTGVSTALCGRFGEFSIPVKDIDASLAFWTPLAPHLVDRAANPHPIALLHAGTFPIGLHQTASFQRPALTYFSPDSADRIAALKAAHFYLTQEFEEDGRIMHACLETPDGMSIFVFGSDAA